MEDFKEIVYFGISLLIAAILITAGVSSFNSIKTQLETVTVNEITAKSNIIENDKYAGYNNKIVSGLDVAALICEEANNDTGHYVRVVELTTGWCTTPVYEHYSQDYNDTWAIPSVALAYFPATNRYWSTLSYDETGKVNLVTFTKQ